MTESRTAVIAVGGNALSPPGERSTIADQFRHTRESLGPIVDLALDGWRVVVVHGNGPQVGDELVRNEKARSEVAPLPLGVLVAGTAGWSGDMLQQSLENALRTAGNAKDVVTLLTQVEVAADDPALKDPKKFIGHGISVARARELRAEGHPVKRDAKGRLRRVVGSPRPLSIHELATIRTLLERGTVVLACGGGGIPIYRDPVLGLEGVDAVVDKDLAAAVLARELGAELFLILTDVEAVYTGWGSEEKRAIRSMSVSEADRLASEGAFGEGSMAPKVAAAADYVRRTNGRAIITELSKGRSAVQGVGGTEIIP
ncbi:MAG: carbamate kinase [Gemmatimonadaceae bacterium]